MVELITDTNNPILRQQCKPVQVLNAEAVFGMIILCADQQGAGLAAPQVGISERFFVTCWGEIFVNPVIQKCEGDEFESIEGCLSIPGKQFRVPRRPRVWIDGRSYEGAQAIIIQHEYDHLDGVLISDNGTEVTP